MWIKFCGHPHVPKKEKKYEHETFPNFMGKFQNDRSTEKSMQSLDPQSFAVFKIYLLLTLSRS